MYRVSLEFNGTTTQADLHVCATKKEASAWVRERAYLATRGHVFVLDKDARDEVKRVAFSADEGNVVPMGWRPKSTKWMTQGGKPARDFSVYAPKQDARR